jgi:N4-gp56 family major capsid protein
MAQVSSSTLSAAITFKLQRNVLKNLRAALVYADRSYATQGDFQPGFDTLTFVNVADLPINSTPLTEGTAPSKRSLTIGTVSVSAAQYGDVESITDVAKVKSPIEIVDIASERLSRQAAESIDQITRDVIAAGGTPFYANAKTTRAGLDSSSQVKAIDLRKLRTVMFKNKIPPFSDGYYRLWVSPLVGYDIRNDTASTGGWVDVNKYSNPDVLLRGELGRMEGFRIMEVVNAPTFSSSVTVQASIALGDIKGWGVGDIQTLNTYHVAPGGDHADFLAQEELVGWKVMWGVAVLNNSYYYRLESFGTAL